MAALSVTWEGGCLCGGIRYRAEGKPRNVRVCHCRLCQTAIGAAFNVRALFPREAVTFMGNSPGRFASSREVVRGFCPRCGTTLFSERPDAGMIGLTLGSFAGPAPTPEAHIWTSQKQPWVRLADELPTYREGAPA